MTRDTSIFEDVWQWMSNEPEWNIHKAKDRFPDLSEETLSDLMATVVMTCPISLPWSRESVANWQVEGF